MAIWDRNDNGNRGNMGGMGGRARNLADRAGNAMRQGMDRSQHGGYDQGNYNAGRATGGWNGDSYSPGQSGGMGGQRFAGNEYDRDFTYRGTPGGNINGGVGRNLGYGYGAGDRDEAGRASMNYDRQYGMGGGVNNGYGAGPAAYDRGYQGGGFQGRNDTDNGDPFGDRQQHTPIRVMRGRDVGNMGGGADYGDRGMMNRNRGGYDSSWAFGARGMERDDINRDRMNRLSSDRMDREDESYRAYQDYSGYNRGLNYEPYYGADDFAGRGGREVGDQSFTGYDSNYRNRRDRDWF